MMIEGVKLCFGACLIKLNLVSCAQAPWCAQASWCAHAPWCVQAPWYRWGDLWALDGVQLVVHQPQPDGDVHLRVASLLHQHHQLGMGWSSIFDPLSSIFDHRSSIFDHRSRASHFDLLWAVRCEQGQKSGNRKPNTPAQLPLLIPQFDQCNIRSQANSILASNEINVLIDLHFLLDTKCWSLWINNGVN